MAPSHDELIAGFSPDRWAAFTSPLAPQYIERDPNGQSYVRHQVCTDALNRCFGRAGWTLEIKDIFRHEPYTYNTKNGEKEGKYFVNAIVRLTIGRGGETTFRDGAGAQVAGGSWDECEKGSVSEALKRAASLFGWASNVYMTDKLDDSWEGEVIMREKRVSAEAGFVLPDHHQTALVEWMTALGVDLEDQQKVMPLVASRDAAYALATVLKALAEKTAAPRQEVADARLPV